MRTKPRPADELQLTPLIDVAFLMLIFFMSLPFKALDAKLESHLPRAHGDVDAALRELCDGSVVALVHLTARVEQGAVEVGDEQLEAGQLAVTG